MNDTLKTIYERRAVRKFKDQPVDREIINQVLDAGRMAPSAINKQPWKFYVLTNKETIQLFSKKIAKAAFKQMAKMKLKTIVKMAVGLFHFPKGISFFKQHDAILHGAPVIVFITSPKDNEWAALDVGMCSQNMMLAAKSLGLDSCPVGLAKFVEYTKIYSRLNIPKSEQVNLAIVLGYGDEIPSVHERIKNNATFID